MAKHKFEDNSSLDDSIWICLATERFEENLPTWLIESREMEVSFVVEGEELDFFKFLRAVIRHDEDRVQREAEQLIEDRRYKLHALVDKLSDMALDILVTGGSDE